MTVNRSAVQSYFNSTVQSTSKTQKNKNAVGGFTFADEFAKSEVQAAQTTKKADTYTSKQAISQTAPAKVRSLTDDELAQLDLTEKTKPTVNMNSQGNIKLTEEQISDLKSRYNITNLSADEQNELLRELTNLGAISTKDFTHGINARGDHRFKAILRKMDSEFPAEVNPRNILDVLADNIDDELYIVDYGEKNLGKGEGSKLVKDSAEIHKRMLAVLEQLR